MDIYETIVKNIPKEDSLNQILYKQTSADPKIKKYKGSRLLTENKLGTTNLFSYKGKEAEKKVLEKSLTPIKSKNTRTMTPTKMKK